MPRGNKKPVAWMKIYKNGEYRGSIVDYSDAAAFAALLGAGTSVRNGHSQSRVIWAEGREEFSAAESYDRAAEVMRSRVEPAR